MPRSSRCLLSVAKVRDKTEQEKLSRPGWSTILKDRWYRPDGRKLGYLGRNSQQDHDPGGIR